MAFSLNLDPKELKEFKERELTRITQIPINKPLSEELHKKFSKATLLSTSDIELLPVQSEAIKAYLVNGGLFGYIKVGGGKALISFACAFAGYRKGLRKIILLIPPKLTQQTVEKVVPWLRRQMAVNLPIHVIAGVKDRKKRLKVSQEKSGIFIVAWSQLSIADTDELIQNISPELIIADEAHNLSNKTSSRYKRINRWMVEHPETEFVALSGTMGKKSLMDYYHLMRWSLKDNAPMPDTEKECGNWAGIIDTTFSEFTPSRILDPLVNWAKRNGQDVDRDIAGYRKAYNYRLVTASGVVFAVGEDDLGASITFINEEVNVPSDYEGMAELNRLRSQLHDMDTSPDGDIIDFAIHKFRYDFELTAGFYNSLTWPEVDILAKRKEISKSDAKELLERSQDYHRASQDYHRVCRKWLQDCACEGLDTPLLLGNSMLHHGPEKVGDDLYNAWITRRNFDFEGRIDRDSKPVRVCDYKIYAVLRWVQNLPKRRGGVIIWYQRNDIGRWCFEILQRHGVDVVLCDATKKGSEAMNNDRYHKNKVMIASITAYKEGINAQQVEYQYFLQPPREAHYWEQSIGRNHRTGTPYDELTYTTNFTSKFDHTMFSAVLCDALFQHQAGSPHKLIYGNYTTQPQIVHAAALKEMGIIQNSQKYSRAEDELKKIFN